MAAGVTVAKNENGKRGRNQMDSEDAEFAPLSKRINNLHLHQGHSSHHQQQQHQVANGISYVENSFNGAGPSNEHRDHDGRNHHNGHYDQGGSMYEHGLQQMPNISHEQNVPSTRMNGHNELAKAHHHHHDPNNYGNQNGVIPHCDYRPTLDSNSNPHYFEANKQLYLLYLERMNRTGQRLHPHFFEYPKIDSSSLCN